MNLSKKLEKKLKETFYLVDIDKDNYINTNEVGLTLRALGIYLTETEINDINNNIDPNNIGKVSYEDFKKTYIAFKGRKNIAEVEIYKKFIQVTINIREGELDDPNHIMSCYISGDGKIIGHHGNGDYYFSISNEDDIDLIMPFIKQSYEINKK